MRRSSRSRIRSVNPAVVRSPHNSAAVPALTGPVAQLSAGSTGPGRAVVFLCSPVSTRQHRAAAGWKTGFAFEIVQSERAAGQRPCPFLSMAARQLEGAASRQPSLPATTRTGNTDGGPGRSDKPPGRAPCARTVPFRARGKRCRAVTYRSAFPPRKGSPAEEPTIRRFTRRQMSACTSRAFSANQVQGPKRAVNPQRSWAWPFHPG